MNSTPSIPNEGPQAINASPQAINASPLAINAIPQAINATSAAAGQAPAHPVSPVRHSMKRRARFHDYREPGLYMVTMAIEGRRRCFGSLVTEPEPCIHLNALGHAAASVVYSAHEFYPNVKVHKVCIMPDHIHFIIGVAGAFPPGKDGQPRHLGHVINGIKIGCRKAARELYPESEPLIFEKGYHDRIIMGNRYFELWARYLDDNPRRLAIKSLNPQYFTVLHDTEICGHRCQITGNRFLLDIPDKMAVIVHRADDDTTFARNKALWQSCGERGGVLVSAAVAPREKEVMRQAMDCGFNLILLRENGFPTPYKPSGEAFDTCANGQLLQISPWGHHYERRVITRDQCFFLNELAMKIAASAE